VPGITASIGGEAIPLNNGVVWVDGVAFTDRLQITNGYKLADGQIISAASPSPMVI
jgi:hypothetical protein